MTKRFILSVIAVFITWSVLDLIIHGVILSSSYAETAHLWRPMESMNMVPMYVVGILVVTFFVSIYAFLIHPRCLASGLKYGVLFGLCSGISMGYGTYSVMPIPHFMAFVWFLGTVVEATAGGLLVGLIIKEPGESLVTD